MLFGSEKQIKWAEELQAKAMIEMKAWLEQVAEEEGIPAEQLEQVVGKVMEVMEGQTCAGWWIECRGIPAEHLYDKLDRDAMSGVGRKQALGYRPFSF